MNDQPWDDFPSDQPTGRISKRATGPSRSQRRREALDVLELAGQMMEATDGIVARLPLSDELREVLTASRRIRQQVARKRQMQYLAKQLRRLDDDELHALRNVFVTDQATIRRDTARLHRLEALRDRLIEGGDEALAELIAEFPDADRTQLRQLQRQAARERDADGAPKAARELFKALRTLLASADQGDDEEERLDDARDA
jgi:ribosome-associated protein